jgi:N-acetyl-alpha-D-glucosaminyl L-malate synthase BshA
MVSHAYPTFDGGSKGAFVHGLASAMVSLGHEVYAVIPWHAGMRGSRLMDGVSLVPYRAYDSVSYGQASNSYIRYPRLEVALSLLGSVFTLYQVTREQKIDIIHAHWAVPMGFVAGLVKAATSVPLVITMHGRDIRVNPEIGSNVPALWYIKPFLRFAFRQADRLITVSHSYRDYAQNAGAPSEKIEIVYNGTDTSRFFPSEEGVAEIRKCHGLSPDSKLLLFVGDLAFHKGLDVLLRAMPYVLTSEPTAVALIVGEGPRYNDLLTLRNALGMQDKCIFVGRVPNAELPPYDNACDVFVMPSRDESFGVAAVEAMACGKPVVGAAVGGLVEIIEDNQNGLLVEKDNVEQLAGAIIRVLKDRSLASRLGGNARRRVETTFNWANVVRETVELYKDVLQAAYHGV